MTTTNNDRWERIEELHSLIAYVEQEIRTLEQEKSYYELMIDKHTPEETADEHGSSEYYQETLDTKKRKQAYWTALLPQLENLVYGTPSK